MNDQNVTLLSEPSNYISNTTVTQTVVAEYMQSMVEEEMRSAGLDPLNKEDVQKFWTLKGLLD